MTRFQFLTRGTMALSRLTKIDILLGAPDILSMRHLTCYGSGFRLCAMTIVLVLDRVR
jgi:hypothetical protein